MLDYEQISTNLYSNPGVNNTLKYWPSCQLAFLVDVLCCLEEPAARYRCLKLAVEIVTLFLALLFMRVCHHIKVGSISGLKMNNNSSSCFIFVWRIWMHIKPNLLAYKPAYCEVSKRDLMKICPSNILFLEMVKHEFLFD